MDAILDEFEVTDSRARAVLSAEAIRAVEAFKADGVGRRAVAAPFQAREVAFELPIAGVTIRGAIDLAYGDPATRAFGVVDFKTDRVTADDIAKLCSERAYDLQLALYALAVRDTFNASTVDAHLFFTEPGVSVRVGFSSSEFENALTRVRPFLAMVEKDAFVAPASPPCSRCGFAAAEICPSRR